MHVGSIYKPSKKDAVSPLPQVFKPPPPILPSNTPTHLLSLTVKPKQESESSKRKREDQQYNQAPGTQPIKVPDGGILAFCKHFKYLGSFISYSLRDDHNIENRLAQASASMGALRHFW